MKLSLCLLLPSALLLAGCSATKRVEELSADYKKQYEAIPAYESLPVRRISWQEALEKMEKNNLELREQLRQYDNSQHQQGRTLRSLIPLIDAGYYYNAPLRWGRGYPTQSNFNINIFFNLPQLVQLPVERYTDALTLIKADTDIRSKRRELEARLYQKFREHELLRREERLEEELFYHNETAKKLTQEGYAEKKRLQWNELCKLMNDYSARWEPEAGTLPAICLKDFRRRAQAPDKLFLANIALQAEAARLQRLGVLIRFLPTAQINFYSPSLFTASGGTMDGFMRNADDIRVNFNSYVTLDTRLETWHDYKDAKKGEELTLKLIEQTMREHKDKVATVLRSWEQYEEWKRGVQEYVAFRNAQGVGDAEEATLRHKESLDTEKALLDQERANLERECAAMQEYGWREESLP